MLQGPWTYIVKNILMKCVGHSGSDLTSCGELCFCDRIKPAWGVCHSLLLVGQKKIYPLPRKGFCASFWMKESIGEHLLSWKCYLNKRENGIPSRRMSLKCSFLPYFIYLFEKWSDTAREGETKRYFITDSLPRWPHLLGLDQAKARSWKLHLGLPYGRQRSVSPDISIGSWTCSTAAGLQPYSAVECWCCRWRLNPCNAMLSPKEQLVSTLQVSSCTASYRTWQRVSCDWNRSESITVVCFSMEVWSGRNRPAEPWMRCSSWYNHSQGIAL